MSIRSKWLNARNDRKKRELDKELEETLAQKVYPGAAFKIDGEWGVVVLGSPEWCWELVMASRSTFLSTDELLPLWREEHQREYDELLVREAVEMMEVEAPLDWDDEYKRRMTGESSVLPAVYRRDVINRRSGLVVSPKWKDQAQMVCYDGYLGSVPTEDLSVPPIGEVVLDGCTFEATHDMLRGAPDGTIVRHPRSGPWNRTKGKWLSAFRVTDVLPPGRYEVLHWGN